QFVNDKRGRLGLQSADRIEMLGKVQVIIEPPGGVRSKYQIPRPFFSQLLKIDNRLGAVFRLAVIDSIFLQEMPAFALCVIENGRVAVVSANNDGIRWRGPLQFQSGFAQG